MTPRPSTTTPEDVASFFTGLDLIGPGVADASTWMLRWRIAAAFHERSDISSPGSSA